MKKVFIYLLFVILGITIYILLNSKDGFSIGIPLFLIDIRNNDWYNLEEDYGKQFAED